MTVVQAHVMPEAASLRKDERPACAKLSPNGILPASATRAVAARKVGAVWLDGRFWPRADISQARLSPGLSESIPLARSSPHTVGMKSNMRLLVGSAVHLAGLAVLVSQLLTG
jgi:hypothetical protein